MTITSPHLVVLGFEFFTLFTGVHRIVNFLRNDKRIPFPAKCLASEFEFFFTQRFTVNLACALTVGRAFTDNRTGDNKRGFVLALLSRGNRAIHLIDVVTVNRSNHIPTVRFKALTRVIREPVDYLTVNGNSIVIVNHNQLVELPGTRQ